MTIPLDNLYDYIFSLTGHNNKNLKMYRFHPHGSKNIKNLIWHNNVNEIFINLSDGHKSGSWHYKLLFCYDQEPLNFSLYENCFDDVKQIFAKKGLIHLVDNPLSEKIIRKKNISGERATVYDKKLLLHSEINSEDLKKYEENGFLGIYYWSHAFIALDWYRFSKFDNAIKLLPKKNFNNDFNIYSRAWSGSREYRLKFLELLKENNIDKVSNIVFNDYCNDTHYSEYNLENKNWQFDKNIIDNLNNVVFRNIDSSASATYNSNDYKNSAIDVVLETVFDKKKIQLTEKILRPIACGKPFILVSEKDSLKYLQSYGFKTFGSLIDESYDYFKDPLKRLNAIIKTMESVSILPIREKNDLFSEMHEIAEYNRNWFFSESFFNKINEELKENLLTKLAMLDDPSYQTAKEIRLIYRSFRKYEKYFPSDKRYIIKDVIQKYPERIELSKKNIGKY